MSYGFCLSVRVLCFPVLGVLFIYFKVFRKSEHLELIKKTRRCINIQTSFNSHEVENHKTKSILKNL
jgi:hypothetical protein